MLLTLVLHEVQPKTDLIERLQTFGYIKRLHIRNVIKGLLANYISIKFDLTGSWTTASLP